ncbi:hypothetical protein Glove_54g23 [Diversispora epigaea]|uniref:Protein kinase domain-containing protein n=1 Tax=Diversispora epigaea TaxID=1348612 RepID=A0A397JCU8_9GLOM|nr:hypothetical protein Glove_54g23 [Diversispora epigaea]
MSQEIYCPAGHSYNVNKYINKSTGICDLCIKEHFIQEFGTWSSGNAEVDKFVQESQKNHQGHYGNRLQWIPYDNFLGINHLANGGYGSVYSAILKNGIKSHWNLNKQDWEYSFVDKRVVLKEINDSRHDTSKFLKEVKNLITMSDLHYITKCFGMSKNPSSQNYIIVMKLYHYSLHKFIIISRINRFWNLNWKKYLLNMTTGLRNLHKKNFIHRDLHSGNILIISDGGASITDLGLCSLENDQILKSDNKSNNIYGSIPYIPPEVLQGNAFTKKGDIYSFGGILYEMATRTQPFYDRAHDTRLIIDICNGVRPKIPDFMNWIPQDYSDLIYKCWSGDPSERPTAKELYDVILNFYWKAVELDMYFKIDYKSLEQFVFSSESHPQSCYISRSIHTLHGLHNSLEDIKSGRIQDPNLLKSNEPTSSSINTYDIDSKESQECIDWEKEIQNKAVKRPFFDISNLDCNSRESKECINLDNEDNITPKKIKKTKQD